VVEGGDKEEGRDEGREAQVEEGVILGYELPRGLSNFRKEVVTGSEKSVLSASMAMPWATCIKTLDRCIVYDTLSVEVARSGAGGCRLSQQRGRSVSW